MNIDMTKSIKKTINFLVRPQKPENHLHAAWCQVCKVQNHETDHSTASVLGYEDLRWSSNN